MSLRSYSATDATRKPRTYGSGVVLDHVADANARLSIDPTGKVAGYQVIQDDDGLTYTFHGDLGGDTVAGVFVAGAGSEDANGSYISAGSSYSQINGSHTFDTGTGTWSLNSNPYYVGVETVTYPWEITTWTAVDGMEPVPTVIKNPIACTANWTP